MADITQPTKVTFNAALAEVKDLLLSQFPALAVKAGSVISELVMRPVAYLYAWLQSNAYDLVYKSSVSYLETSLATENAIADYIASNYFVTRKSSTLSSGALEVHFTGTQILRLGEGTRFDVAGATVETRQTVIVALSLPESRMEGVLYVQALQDTDGTYYGAVPVFAIEPGALDIAPGVVAEPLAAISYFDRAFLVSAVTGGTDVETDAEMIARVAYSTVDTGVGSYNALRRVLQDCPVVVTDMATITGDSPLIKRAEFNSLTINMGGLVDAYVKTSTQPSTTVTELVLADDGKLYEDQSLCYIQQIISDPTEPALSITREVMADGTFRFAVAGEAGTYKVALTNMPGTVEVNAYMNSPEHSYPGQSLHVYPAIPVYVDMRCSITATSVLSDDDITAIKQTIVGFVNDTRIGQGTLNFSDICTAVEGLYPGVRLRLPCVMHYTMVNSDGSVTKQAETSGILSITDIPANNAWPFAICYFVTTLENIEIVQL